MNTNYQTRTSYRLGYTLTDNQFSNLIPCVVAKNIATIINDGRKSLWNWYPNRELWVLCEHL